MTEQQRPIGLPSRTSLVAGLLLVALLGPLIFGVTGRDDVYLTLWPALALSERAEILNYNGSFIEQSSSILHVSFLALLIKATGLHVVDLNWLMIFTFGLACIAVIVHLTAALVSKAAGTASVLLSLNSLFVYWMLSGMDAVLSALFWMIFVYGWMKCLRGLGTRLLVVGIFGLSLARPENVLVALLASAFFTMKYHFVDRPDFRIADSKVFLHTTLGLLGVSAVTLAWRWFYFSSFVPQPVVAKASHVDFNRLWSGALYLWELTAGNWALIPLWVAIFRSSISALRGQQSVEIDFTVCICLAGLMFVVASGGDWMENGRFLVPFVPLLIVVLVNELSQLPNSSRAITITAMIMINAIGLTITAAQRGTGDSPLALLDTHILLSPEGPIMEQFNRIHRRQLEVVPVLRRETARIFRLKGSGVSIMSEQAGMMMFHLAETNFKEFRFIDLAALSTTDFSNCRPAAKLRERDGRLRVTLSSFFLQPEKLGLRCHIGSPDIIFDLDNIEHDILSTVVKSGYTPVLVLTGPVKPLFRLLAGISVRADQFIAIRNDLLSDEQRLQRGMLRSDLPSAIGSD